jgi:hypothetical protein
VTEDAAMRDDLADLADSGFFAIVERLPSR